jgi:hypothetical protein
MISAGEAAAKLVAPFFAAGMGFTLRVVAAGSPWPLDHDRRKHP